MRNLNKREFHVRANFLPRFSQHHHDGDEKPEQHRADDPEIGRIDDEREREHHRIREEVHDGKDADHDPDTRQDYPAHEHERDDAQVFTDNDITFHELDRCIDLKTSWWIVAIKIKNSLNN